MKKILLFLSVALVVLSLGSCGKRAAVSTAYSYPPQIVGAELDGSLTIRVWGDGRNRTDAIQQARKEAVYAVVLKGLDAPQGMRISQTRALVLENNAEDKYRAFFNDFFADGGKYNRFVTRQDRRTASNGGQRSSQELKYGITVRVLRSELEAYLVEEGIIKQ